MKLGHRLAAIASLVPSGAKLADIGTDHAYLPIYLVHNNIIENAVAGDVRNGPLEAARRAVSANGLLNKISLRLGDGLAVITPGEVDTVVIAGMGGGTITDILTASHEVVSRLRCLILQPMIGAALVRKWLVNNGWKITAEQLVEDDGRLYEIITASPGQAKEMEPILYEIGPLLWLVRHPLLDRHLAQLISQAGRVISEMNVSEQARQSPKYDEYKSKLEQLEEYRCRLLASK